MKRLLALFIGILIVLVLFLWSHCANQNAEINVFNAYTWDESFGSQRDAFFQCIVDMIREGYSYLEHKQSLFGFKWDVVSSYYGEKIRKIESEGMFLYVCKEMLSILQDGHTIIYPRAISMSFPFWIKENENGYEIYGFSRELAENVPWLMPGQYILSIDGMPVDSVVDEILAHSGFHLVEVGRELIVNDFMEKYYFYCRREAGLAKSVMEIKLEDGSIMILEFAWQEAPIPPYQFASVERTGVTMDILANGTVGYLKIDSLTADLFSIDDVDRAFQAIWNTDHLIIDLRNNGGGDFTTYGRHILSYFVSEPITVNTKVFRNSPYLHIFGQEGLHYPGTPKWEGDWYDAVSIPAKTREILWEKPVTVLVNERLYSSAHILLTALADLNIATIVGRLTPLHSGQPLHISTPWKNWQFSMSSIVSRGPTGSIIEDRMIIPDIYVPITRSEILGSEDPILDAALTFVLDSY